MGDESEAPAALFRRWRPRLAFTRGGERRVGEDGGYSRTTPAFSLFSVPNRLRCCTGEGASSLDSESEAIACCVVLAVEVVDDPPFVDACFGLVEAGVAVARAGLRAVLLMLVDAIHGERTVLFFAFVVSFNGSCVVVERGSSSAGEVPGWELIWQWRRSTVHRERPRRSTAQ